MLFRALRQQVYMECYGIRLGLQGGEACTGLAAVYVGRHEGCLGKVEMP